MEIAKFEDMDYVCVVGKGLFSTGDVVAYIPEASIVPQEILTKIGLEGKLSGPDKNRVKAARLRGVLSQGLVYSMHPNTPVGINVQSQLGITKYEPLIPENMAGQVQAEIRKPIDFSVENIKKESSLFIPEDIVVVTEKIHGTWCMLARVDGEPLVTSLGRMKKGLSLKINEENAQNNVYVKAFRNAWQWERMDQELPDTLDFYVLGEIYGPGIQDLTYGVDKPTFKVFDICINGEMDGIHYNYHWMNDYEIQSWKWGQVPVLYRGWYDREAVDDLATGNSTLPGADHIKEGVVIRGLPDKYDKHSRRRLLKAINPDYLLRKGGTERT